MPELPQYIEQPEVLDQQDTAEVLQEMPGSHIDVDPATMTTKGLMKTCDYFAQLAAKNPKLARTQAKQAITALKEDNALRKNGMESSALKSKKFASLRDRHREKIKPQQKLEPKQKPTLGQTPNTPVSVSLRAESEIRVPEVKVLATAEATPYIDPSDINIIPPQLLFAELQVSSTNYKQILKPQELGTDFPKAKDTNNEQPSNAVVKNVLRQADEPEVSSLEPYAENSKPVALKANEVTVFEEQPMNVQAEELSENELVSVYWEPSTLDVLEQNLPDISDETNIDQADNSSETTAEALEKSESEQLIETFLSVYSEPNTSSTEEVKDQADQPVTHEKVVQVSEELFQDTYLAENPQEIEEVRVELLKLVLESGVKGEATPELTPDVAEQFIALLRIYGYEDPHDVLVQYVSTYGYVFWLQMIEDLVDQEKLAEQGNVSSAKTVAKSDQDISTRLTKFLFGLIGMLPKPISESL